MKHTKGPWKAVKYQNTSYYTVRQDHATYGIDAKTLAGSDDDLKFHDAHLIAAAPEMLEALEHLEKEVCPDEFVKHSKDAIKKLKDVIKKAKGIK